MRSIASTVSAFTPLTWLMLALVSAVCAVPFYGLRENTAHAFTVTLKSSTPGMVQLYYDIGRGMREEDSQTIPIPADGTTHSLQFSLPEGDYRDFRFDPLDRSGTIEISDAKIVDPKGRTIRAFLPSEFQPVHEIAEFKVEGPMIRVTTVPGSTDSIITLKSALDPPVRLGKSIDLMSSSYWRATAVHFFIIGLSTLGYGFFAESPIKGRVGKLIGTYPVRSIALFSTIAVCLANHPIVFFGKSLVSPNLGATFLVYGQLPTLPGASDPKVHDVGESDVGAIMWQHVPLSSAQQRALFRDHQMPLWNRYNSGGVTMLGQGQSCFGDPLHFIAVLGRGAAWAWDLKYCSAKILFSFGLGLIVWYSYGAIFPAIIVAIASSFIGEFIYRVNHPAVFSVCYAPWILLVWVKLTNAKTRYTHSLWLVGWIVANFCVLTSGTVKEAYMLLLGVNFTGLMILLCSEKTMAVKARRIASVGVAGFLFVLIASPVWLTFYDSLARSYTSYDAIRAFQLQPGMLLGLFDELFYRVLMGRPAVMDPSINFLLLIGVIWSFVCISATWKDRTARALILSLVPCLTMIYGGVPPSIIAKIPFLANVAHIDNSFSCVAIVQLATLSGIGFWLLGRSMRGQDAIRDLRVFFIIFAGLILLFLGTVQAVEKSPFSLAAWDHPLINRFTWVYLGCLILGVSLVLFSLRSILSTAGVSLTGILVMVFGIILLLWRFSFYNEIGFEKYTVSPGTRPDFFARSPAIEAVRTKETQPFRFVGFGGDIFPGWSGFLDVETISGPDALMNKYYRELMSITGIDRVWDWRYVVHSNSVAELRPVYDFLNVKYYFGVGSDSALIGKSLTHVASKDMDVYESERAWPRAYFTDRIAVYRRPEELVDWIKHATKPLAGFLLQDWEKSAALRSLSGDTESRTVVPAEQYRLSTNQTEFTVRASGAGVIVLQEAFLKDDFQVEVNGQAMEYYRTNHAFKSVWVDKAGLYRVKFAYWPRHLTFSIALFCIGIATTGLLLLRERRYLTVQY